MAKNTNSASRLLAILKAIPYYPDNEPTLRVWATAFNVSIPEEHRRARVVADRLSAMSRELAIVRDQMLVTNYSDELYAMALSRVDQAISTFLLPGSWVQARQHLSPETLTALEFCREIIPDEESSISAEDLDDIASRVSDLQDALGDAQLPLRLKVLVQHHLDLIRQALTDYPIKGVKALREAARSAVGELVEVRTTIVEARESGVSQESAPVFSKLGGLWAKVNTVADTALKGEKLLQLGHKILELLS